MPCMHGEAFIIYVLLSAHNFFLLPLEHFTLIPLKSFLLGSFLTYINSYSNNQSFATYYCFLTQERIYLTSLLFLSFSYSSIYRNPISVWKVYAIFIFCLVSFANGYDPAGSEIPSKCTFLHILLSRKELR